VLIRRPVHAPTARHTTRTRPKHFMAAPLTPVAPRRISSQSVGNSRA
jgi:hypothetical protein